MFIQRGYAPLHLVLTVSDLSADECLPHLGQLFKAGAEVNQTITEGEWVCIFMLNKALTYFIFCYILFNSYSLIWTMLYIT